MALDTHKYYAAITGDVINSSAFNDSNRDLLHDSIQKVGAEVYKFFPGFQVGDLSIFRGDSIQFLLSDPVVSLRVALFFRAAFKAILPKQKVDMRLSIGIGTVSFLPSTDQGGADGEAYRLSGASLDKLSAKETMAINVSSEWGTDLQRRAFQTIAVLLGFQAGGWTSKQALAVKWGILNKTQEEISRLWPETVSRQAIAKNLDAAGFFAVEQGLRFFEENKFNTWQP